MLLLPPPSLPFRLVLLPRRGALVSLAQLSKRWQPAGALRLPAQVAAAGGGVLQQRCRRARTHA